MTFVEGFWIRENGFFPEIGISNLFKEYNGLAFHFFC